MKKSKKQREKPRCLNGQEIGFSFKTSGCTSDMWRQRSWRELGPSCFLLPQWQLDFSDLPCFLAIGKWVVSFHMAMMWLWNISSVVPSCSSSWVIPPQHPQTGLQNWTPCSKGPQAPWQALRAGLKDCPSLHSFFLYLSVYLSNLSFFPCGTIPSFHSHSPSSSCFLFSHS